MEAKSSKQAERSEATRARLVRAGRALFAKRGYADVGTEEIVRKARVTRGALYHHFADKQDLFRAVHEDLERELSEGIAADIAGAGTADPVEALRVGITSFLDACESPELARISLLEAPTVLGRAEWREIDERYGLGLAMAALEAGMEAGALKRQPVRPLAQLLLAAMGEAGMAIAESDDPKRTRRELEVALLALLDGLRDR
jgi:AcrR family transcriptional regulator